MSTITTLLVGVLLIIQTGTTLAAQRRRRAYHPWQPDTTAHGDAYQIAETPPMRIPRWPTVVPVRPVGSPARPRLRTHLLDGAAGT